MLSTSSGRVVLQCKFCHKGFTKGEHLRRHERSHTGAKPYQCKECKRSFSRQDSLARHEKLHRRRNPEDASSPTESIDKPITPESLRNGDLTEGFPGVVPDVLGFPPTSLAAGVPQPAAGDLDFELIWPDSEDLLQTLMSSDASNQWQIPLGTLPFSATPSTADLPFETPSSFDERPPSIGAIPSGGNHQAVQDVSKMVSNVSSSVTAAARSNSITSVFLDECLHMFFVKFIPTFPVLHRATFVFRDCAHPLLLNAIAIGSLYLGPKDAVAKGEALWYLAHTAIATSWQSLITHRGPYDACDGVQLVVTGVLSQVYGALSKNRAIRSTSQAFHSLGFVWARRCGMLDSEPYPLESVPSPDAAESEKEYQWRLWVAREIQQRALLAHYMLDGLISQMSGEPTSVRHATNQLTLPSDEAAFEASTADEWISYMQASASFQAPSFRSILRRLFHPMDESSWLDTTLSAFSYKVILEGLQSLISDDDSEEGTAVGVPTRGEVRAALNQVYESIRLNPTLSSADRFETLLRWHAICLDTNVDSSLLCRNLCAKYAITQHIWRNGHGPKSNIDLAAWVITPAARSALLHAMAIQEIIEQLPRGRAHAIHMPSSLFAAATVYSVFALGGQPALKIPSTVVWQDVLLCEHPSGSRGCEPPPSSTTSASSYLPPPSSPAPPTSLSPSSSLYTATILNIPDLPGTSSSSSAMASDTARYVRGESCRERTRPRATCCTS
ncbi:Fungal specific transcription factor domain-containing protein [Cladophialophora immunda]|nr:Fungal specific transcription factor domain-containing protein [Cladophialophora immunda]